MNNEKIEDILERVAPFPADPAERKVRHACLTLLGRRGGTPEAALAILETHAETVEAILKRGRRKVEEKLVGSLDLKSPQAAAREDLAKALAATRKSKRAHNKDQLVTIALAAGLELEANDTKDGMLDDIEKYLKLEARG